MKLTNGLNKRVVEIYRGGELVWEMPRVYLVVNGFMSGNKSVRVNVYPKNCTISIIIGNYQTNKHEEYNFDLVSDSKSILLENRIEPGDYIDVTAECEGWKKSNFWTKTR